jgi:hypothetical protein
MSAKMCSWTRLRMLSAAMLIFWAGGGAMHAAKIAPTAWTIYPLRTPAPLTGVTVNQTVSSGTNPVAPSLPNLAANLIDNNPATLVTLSNTPGLVIDLGQTNVVDRVFLIGGNHQLNLWPNQAPDPTNPPLGLIVVSVGNNGSTMKPVGEWTVPYDAGNPVDTEVDLRFSPAAGRFVQIQLQTNITWGINHWPGWALASQPPAPVNLKWNVGEVELYGFGGPATNLNAVVCDSQAQPLQTAAVDLSYYLGELTGTPHPIITSSQTNLYPGRIYRIVDLASFAPDYNTMMANIASGVLPTNLVVSVAGREIQFSGWPYRCVVWSVWEFLERQGVRWLYPDAHGDFVPTGNGVNFGTVPFQYTPSAISIYANFSCGIFQPWAAWMKQSVRQEFLYPWRNWWTCATDANGPLGGSEIPALPAPNVTVNSNYTEGFVGYPHNFNGVVPNRILDQHPNWWGWTNTSPGSAVSPETPGAPAFTMDDPTLISWVANKMTNIAAAQPLASTWPLNICHWRRSYNLLPLDASTYSQDPLTIASNGPAQANPEPWVKLYDQSVSGAYFSFVTAVADQVKQKGSGALVGALAYADVFPPPTNITTFPDNVQVEVCLYGAPNLPMSASANAGMKAALDGWHAKCSRLAVYDYALLHTDYQQPDPRLPVPLVAGMVDRAQYLASVGALDGGCQANVESIQYNPWNFYAYPRIRWNTNQSAAQLEQEFFTGYFREAAAPMLAYYQGLENYQVTNGVNLYYGGYCYGITPGSFPLNVLSAMKTNLVQAENLATNWVTIDRVAKVRAGFDWVILNSGRQGMNLNDASPYPILNPTNGAVTINLAKMQDSPTSTNNSYFDNSTYWGNQNGLNFFFGAQPQQTFNVAVAGNYTVTVTAKGISSSLGVLEPNGAQTQLWPILNVFLGPASGSFAVNSTNFLTFSFTNTIPSGVWDLVVKFNNAATAGSRDLFISSIQINRQ